MQVIDPGQAQTMDGPERWFTGQVWIETINDEPAPSRLRSSLVTFTPGARTAWHTHPTGQTLRMVSGIARVQGKDGPVREVGPGGTVAFAPGEWLWHGATPDTPMAHLALQDAAEDGTEAEWGEPVTDREYLS